MNLLCWKQLTNNPVCLVGGTWPPAPAATALPRGRRRTEAAEGRLVLRTGAPQDAAKAGEACLWRGEALEAGGAGVVAPVDQQLAGQARPVVHVRLNDHFVRFLTVGVRIIIATFAAFFGRFPAGGGGSRAVAEEPAGEAGVVDGGAGDGLYVGLMGLELTLRQKY